MTYLGSETSQHDGKPTELYRFAGTYENFYYTSGQKKVTYQAPDEEEPNDYLPIAMRRSEINCGTQEDDGLDLTVQLAVTNRVVQVYGFQASPPSLELTIFRFHTLAEVIAYWTGPVNDIQVADGVATIRSPSTLSAALATNIPNFYFQSPCNNVLFDRRCKVVEADWTDTAEVLAIDGRVITVDSVGTLAGKLIGGEVRLASGERRMITAEGPTVIVVPGPDIDAYQLIVNFPFSQLEVGDSINATAGCDLAYLGDCRTKFDNNRNFGGFPFIPSANPFQDGIDPAVVPLADATCLPSPFTGASTTFRYSQPDPCNPAYMASRQLYTPDFQPNAPHGKHCGTFNPLPANGVGEIREFDDFVNPASPNYQNPAYVKLQGQVLVSWVMANLEHTVVYHFPTPYGAWALTIQYPAFFCGTVGKDHGRQLATVTKLDEDGNITIATVVDEDVSGNTVYNWFWNV